MAKHEDGVSVPTCTERVLCWLAWTHYKFFLVGCCPLFLANHACTCWTTIFAHNITFKSCSCSCIFLGWGGWPHAGFCCCDLLTGTGLRTSQKVARGHWGHVEAIPLSPLAVGGTRPSSTCKSLARSNPGFGVAWKTCLVWWLLVLVASEVAFSLQVTSSADGLTLHLHWLTILIPGIFVVHTLASLLCLLCLICEQMARFTDPFFSLAPLCLTFQTHTCTHTHTQQMLTCTIHI